MFSCPPLGTTKIHGLCYPYWDRGGTKIHGLCYPYWDRGGTKIVKFNQIVAKFLRR